MPEHVHLLVGEPQDETLAEALKSLKQGVSRRLIGESYRFWCKRYFDFNVRSHAAFVEKLRYVHRNPVMRGLCKVPEEWEWSSYRHYATGVLGRVEIESEWTADRRERLRANWLHRLNYPTQAKSRLEWGTVRPGDGWRFI